MEYNKNIGRPYFAIVIDELCAENRQLHEELEVGNAVLQKENQELRELLGWCLLCVEQCYPLGEREKQEKYQRIKEILKNNAE